MSRLDEIRERQKILGSDADAVTAGDRFCACALAASDDVPYLLSEIARLTALLAAPLCSRCGEHLQAAEINEALEVESCRACDHRATKAVENETGKLTARAEAAEKATEKTLRALRLGARAYQERGTGPGVLVSADHPCIAGTVSRWLTEAEKGGA